MAAAGEHRCWSRFQQAACRGRWRCPPKCTAKAHLTPYKSSRCCRSCSAPACAAAAPLPAGGREASRQAGRARQGQGGGPVERGRSADSQQALQDSPASKLAGPCLHSRKQRRKLTMSATKSYALSAALAATSPISRRVALGCRAGRDRAGRRSRWAAVSSQEAGLCVGGRCSQHYLEGQILATAAVQRHAVPPAHIY